LIEVELSEVNSLFDSGNYLEIVSKYEDNSLSYSNSFKESRDRTLFNNLVLSYHHLGRFHRCLDLIDLLDLSGLLDKGVIKIKDVEFYYLLKAECYRNLGLLFQEYYITKKLLAIDVDNDKYSEQAKLIEEKIYQKYRNAVYLCVPVLFVLVILAKHLFNLKFGFWYIPVIVAFLLWIALSIWKREYADLVLFRLCKAILAVVSQI
jgi:hypothetical protein